MKKLNFNYLEDGRNGRPLYSSELDSMMRKSAMRRGYKIIWDIELLKFPDWQQTIIKKVVEKPINERTDYIIESSKNHNSELFLIAYAGLSHRPDAMSAIKRFFSTELISLFWSMNSGTKEVRLI